MMPYMSAQRFRTRRGLDYLQRVTNVRNSNVVLAFMQRVFQANGTMWTEGVWEFVRARQSPTNVTGFSSAQADIEGKGLEIFNGTAGCCARTVSGHAAAT